MPIRIGGIMSEYVYGLYAEYYTGDELEMIFSTREKAIREQERRINDCVDYHIKKIKVH